MNISELSLRRPVLAIVMNIIIVLFGVIGFKFLGVRDYPAIDPPNISVRTAYPGANADIVETQRERRRLKVLAMLADKPETQRAFITDMESDPDNVIMTIAIRDQYTFEMLIPKSKYDPFILLELIKRGAIQ